MRFCISCISFRSFLVDNKKNMRLDRIFFLLMTEKKGIQGYEEYEGYEGDEGYEGYEGIRGIRGRFFFCKKKKHPKDKKREK